MLVPTVVKDPTIGTTDRTRGNIKTEGEYTDTSSDKQSPKEISHGLSTGSTPSDVTRMATVKVNTEQPITEQQNVSRVSWSLSTPSTEYDADFPASRSAGSGDNSQHSVIDANDTDTEVEEEVSSTNSTIWLFGMSPFVGFLSTHTHTHTHTYTHTHTQGRAHTRTST